MLKAKERILSVLSSAVELFQDINFGRTDIGVVSDDGLDSQDHILILSYSDSENISDSDHDSYNYELTLNDQLCSNIIIDLCMHLSILKYVHVLYIFAYLLIKVHYNKTTYI